jgi:CubicO group peptidase (beta-lactamase class C family)
MIRNANRRDILTLAGAALMTSGMPPLADAAATKAAPWKTASPAETGFAPDLEARFEAVRAAGQLRNLHGVVVLRQGAIVFERYLAGVDEARGRSLGDVAFGPETLHDLRSVTKSIVSLLYGIALADKRVPAPGEPLLAQFPEYPDLAKDKQLAALTVANALTMTLGMQWNEDLSYMDPRNSETAMDAASDRYRFILERPIVAAPGEVWIYSGGAVALIGRLIEKGTGQKLQDFARSALFEPLGIENSDWAKGLDGEAIAASGLRLTPRDLARIGQMVLAGGSWGGRTIVPSAWLEAAFKPVAMVRDGQHYGYLWRVGELAYASKSGTRGERYMEAVGNGGQILAILPERALVIAVTAGNYNDPKAGEVPQAVLRRIVLPSLVA